MAGRDTDLSGLIGKAREAAARNPATERLLHEAERLAREHGKRLLDTIGTKLGEFTDKLGAVADGSAGPGSLIGRVGKEMSEGAGPGKAVAKGGLKAAKDKIKPGGGSSGGGKSMNIIEDIDIGVPVRVAYGQWTAYKEFPKWSKGAQSVNQDDEVSANWKAKVAFSTRNWNSKITEQIPDQKIAWTSEGPKGVVNGVVTFHEIGDRLTKVLLVLEYIPGGFFEKTANLWRAPGRRARLDLKLFRRFVMTNPEAGENAWRGEIRDGEVVRDHDEVIADEERDDSGNGSPDEEEDDYDEDYDEEDEDDYDEEDEDKEEEERPPPHRRAPARRPAARSRRR